MTEFLKSNNYLIFSFILNILFIILFIINYIRLANMKKSYDKFMKKLGKGENIEEMLKNHLEKVEFVHKQNEEILDYCRKIDNDFGKTISKIGIVRYSAFKDTGSDLSFTLAGWKGSLGNLIVITHGNGVQTYYGHCSKLIATAGQKVSTGDVIAKVGSTGRSTGSHLHFEIRVNGSALNPLSYVGY